MPPRKKPAQSDAYDIDALLAEAGGLVNEPDPVTVKWKGRLYDMPPLEAMSPHLLLEMHLPHGFLKLLRDALKAQFDEFPVPRAVEVRDGRAEFELFIEGWAAASKTGVAVGESLPSPQS